MAEPGSDPDGAGIGAGVARADRFVVYALALFRGLQLVVGLVVLVLRVDQYQRVLLVVAMYAATAGWSVWLFGRAYRRGRVRAPDAVGDVAVIGVALLVVGVSARGGEAETWSNWAYSAGTTTTMLAGAVLPLTVWLACAGLLAAALTGGAWPGLSAGAASTSNAIGNAVSYFTLGLIAYALARYLNSTGRRIDEANRRMLAAEVARAAERARFEDRITRYRELHDTVLQTLTALARGGLDPASEEVRARCARDSDYVRRLIEGDVDSDGAGGDLARAMEQVIAESTAFGLRVHYRAVDLPSQLPDSAVAALAGGVREALSNVHRHAGVEQAWVTVTGELGGVVLRVVDRGVGFDPQTKPEGFGLTQSIRARAVEAGGMAGVSSSPGDGTIVELIWPASLPTLSLTGRTDVHHGDPGGGDRRRPDAAGGHDGLAGARSGHPHDRSIGQRRSRPGSTPGG